jgi:molybdopterin-guanine dinucleotide biosynthesis protein B
MPVGSKSERVASAPAEAAGPPRVFGLVGWSGSGKTSLLRLLLPELVGRGLTVSTIKHAHHGFDLDKPGKDSWLHRQAGAAEVMVASAERWALMRDHRGGPEPTLADLLSRMAPVDLVLVEGFKREPYPKLEVHRVAYGKPLLCGGDPDVVAIASDQPLPGATLPCFALADVPGIADFIVDHCGLGRPR